MTLFGNASRRLARWAALIPAARAVWRTSGGQGPDLQNIL